MADVEVPPYFLCPISLEIMKDPVTLGTGITYDRDSIEKWIFSQKNTTCPVTKQNLILSDADDYDDQLMITLTPNITLRRLIQSWCTLHASHGVERLPTPNPPVTKSQVLKLLNHSHDHITCLNTLKSIASHSQTNRRCLEMAGTAHFLASLIIQKLNHHHSSSTSDSCDSIGSHSQQVCDEALSVLYTLQLSESTLNSICSQELVQSLTTLMQFGSYESRAYSVMLLKSILEVAARDPSQTRTSVLINLNPQFFIECTQILSNDPITHKSAKDTLKLLVNVCQWGRNRIKAVEAGAVAPLIDLLLDCPDKRTSEMILILLEFLCQCAEGRAELLNHGAGLAVVSKKIMRISQTASERAVKILHSIAKFSGSGGVLQEMLQIGVVAKLCFVLQTDCGVKMKEKAKEILQLHARAWRFSPCLPHDFIIPL